jgi:hypothetical protein
VYNVTHCHYGKFVGYQNNSILTLVKIVAALFNILFMYCYQINYLDKTILCHGL